MQEIGIQEPSGHYMMRGYDQLGLWLEHPGIIIKHVEDQNGQPLPSHKQTQEEIDAVYMVHWDNIAAMMYYPDREGFDFPDQFKKEIGFRFKEKK